MGLVSKRKKPTKGCVKITLLAHPESAKIRIMTNSKTEISLTKKVFAKIVSAVSAMALAVSLAGAVSAEEYTESYDAYADNGTAAVQ